MAESGVAPAPCGYAHIGPGRLGSRPPVTMSAAFEADAVRMKGPAKPPGSAWGFSSLSGPVIRSGVEDAIVGAPGCGVPQGTGRLLRVPDQDVAPIGAPLPQP